MGPSARRTRCGANFDVHDQSVSRAIVAPSVPLHNAFPFDRQSWDSGGVTCDLIEGQLKGPSEDNKDCMESCKGLLPHHGDMERGVGLNEVKP